MGYTGTQLLFLFFFFGFMGWLLEVFYAFFRVKKFVNRGFLRGPICPLYGLGMVGIVLISKGIELQPFAQNPVLGGLQIFLLAFLFTSLLEYVTGYLLETFFHQKWWDYKDEKFNLKGRICLKFSVYWGILGLLIIKVIGWIDISMEQVISFEIQEKLLNILIPIFVIDFVTSIDLALKLKQLMKELKDASEKVKEKIEEAAFETLEHVKLKANEKTELLEEMKRNFKEKTLPKAQKLTERFSLDKEEATLFLMEWKLKMKEYRLDWEEEMDKRGYKMAEQARRYQRWLEAFPNMQSKRYQKAIKNLKERKERLEEEYFQRKKK